MTTRGERAQALILAGKVLVNGQKVEKAGAGVEGSPPTFACSEKISNTSAAAASSWRAALEHWHIDVAGKICLDVGTSTGGFTDCLLQRGAARVVAVDTGQGQIDFRLRQDARVRLLEKTNARYLTSQQVGEAVELVVMDVSFISATLVLPAVIAAAFPPPNDAGSANRGPGKAAVRSRTGASREGRHRARSRCASAAVEKVRQELLTLSDARGPRRSILPSWVVKGIASFCCMADSKHGQSELWHLRQSCRCGKSS